MNTIATMKINQAIGFLHALEGYVATLPASARESIPGASHIAATVEGLELAKRAINGEPLGLAPVATNVNYDALLDE